MKKALLTIFILIALPVCINGQKRKLEFNSGVHFSQMRRLSALNNYIKKSLPFDTKIVSDFPGYWYYMPSLIRNTEKIDFGVSYLLTSTGSRLCGMDYSGEYIFDIKEKANAPAIYLGSDFRGSGNLSYRAGVNFGTIYTKLHLLEYLIVDNQYITYSSDDFKSSCLYFLPQFEVYYNIKFISVGLNIGSLFQIANNKRFYFLNKLGYYLADPETYDPIFPEWNGYQLGMSISILY